MGLESDLQKANFEKVTYKVASFQILFPDSLGVNLQKFLPEVIA